MLLFSIYLFFKGSESEPFPVGLSSLPALSEDVFRSAHPRAQVLLPQGTKIAREELSRGDHSEGHL
jgi:hypothetical protein